MYIVNNNDISSSVIAPWRNVRRLWIEESPRNSSCAFVCWKIVPHKEVILFFREENKLWREKFKENRRPRVRILYKLGKVRGWKFDLRDHGASNRTSRYRRIRIFVHRLSLLSSVMRLSGISRIVVKSLSHRRLAAQWRNIISITMRPCRKSEPYPRSYRHVEGRGS